MENLKYLKYKNKYLVLKNTKSLSEYDKSIQSYLVKNYGVNKYMKYKIKYLVLKGGYFWEKIKSYIPDSKTFNKLLLKFTSQLPTNITSWLWEEYKNKENNESLIHIFLNKIIIVFDYIPRNLDFIYVKYMFKFNSPFLSFLHKNVRNENIVSIIKGIKKYDKGDVKLNLKDINVDLINFDDIFKSSSIIYNKNFLESLIEYYKIIYDHRNIELINSFTDVESLNIENLNLLLNQVPEIIEHDDHKKKIKILLIILCDFKINNPDKLPDFNINQFLESTDSIQVGSSRMLKLIGSFGKLIGTIIFLVIVFILNLL